VSLEVHSSPFGVLQVSHERNRFLSVSVYFLENEKASPYVSGPTTSQLVLAMGRLTEAFLVLLSNAYSKGFTAESISSEPKIYTASYGARESRAKGLIGPVGIGRS
jgi:hypothetical protein